MEGRSYTPKERIKFYKFITSRGEWDTLRQLAGELGWDKNRIRQFNRIRAYWEGRSSQKRQGGRTAYMDELINAYFKEVWHISPMNVIIDETLNELEYRATFYDVEDTLDYIAETMFYESDEGLYESPFAYVEINEEGEVEVKAGQSNPAKNK